MSIQPNPGASLWPAEWQGCRITGRFADFLGQPLTGSVKLTPTAPAVIAGVSKTIIIGSTLTVSLDSNGAIDITVPATNDPDINPTGWTYSVVENFPGGRNYSIDAPMNATRDLTAIAPVPSAGGVPITRGESAYETAVRLGYNGTEAQWLASLTAATPAFLGGPVAVVNAPAQGASRIWSRLASPAAGANFSAVPANAANTVSGLPFVVGAKLTIASLAVNVLTAQAATTARVGIYAAAAGGMPTTPVWDSGSIDCSVAGVKSFTPGAAIVLTPGVYWSMGTVSSTTTVRLASWTWAGNADVLTNGAFGSANANFAWAPGTATSAPSVALPSLAAITDWGRQDANGRGAPTIMVNVTGIG